MMPSAQLVYAVLAAQAAVLRDHITGSSEVDMLFRSTDMLEQLTSQIAEVATDQGRAEAAAQAAGAIGGAILGALIAGPRNAGAGLLIGGATGAVVGTAADASAQRQANMTQAQINESMAQGHARADSYRRALGACLQGRGYTVS